MEGEKVSKGVVGQAYAVGWRGGYAAALKFRGVRLDSRDAIRRDVARFVEVQQQRRKANGS